MADNSWYENDPVVKTAGAGRGGQGGATTADLLKYKQDQFAKSGQPYIRMDSNPDSSWKDTALTALRGYGEGATMGLIKYPQAALSSLVNGESYSGALKNIRADNAELARTQPGAFLGGQLGGGAVLGALTGGAATPSMARTIGTAALSGGIQGGTQNDYTNLHDLVGDVAAGTAAGAVGGTAAHGLGWLAGKPGEVLKKELVNGGFTSAEAQESMSNPKILELLDMYGYNALTNIKAMLKGSTAPIVGGAVTGGAAGAGHALVTGGDIPREAAGGAASGAALALGVTKANAVGELGHNITELTKSVSGKMLPAIPKILSTTAPTIGEQVGSLGTGMVTTPQPEDTSWYTSDPIYKDNRSPIRKEIDRWDSKSN